MMKTLLATLLGATTLLAHAESATYVVDPNHTSVIWEALHMGTSTLRGRFDVKEGSVTVDRAAKTGKADIGIDLLSLSTPVKHLENGLRGEQGFNVAASPSARFTSERFTFEGDNKLGALDGMLTVMGKSVPVTLRAIRFNCYPHPMLKREVCGGDFEGNVSRSQLGVNLAPGGAADNVRLLVQIEAIKQQ